MKPLPVKENEDKDARVLRNRPLCVTKFLCKFRSTERSYENFPQISDEEVVQTLEEESH